MDQIKRLKKSISVKGQFVDKIDCNGLINYYKHEDVEDEALVAMTEQS